MNKRTSETRKKLYLAMGTLLKDKKPEEITVKELCKTAQIHRTTFYDHYKSPQALYREMYENLVTEMISSASDMDLTLRKIGTRLCNIALHNKDFFLYASQNTDFVENIVEKMTTWSQNLDVSYFSYTDAKDQKYAQLFFCFVVIAVIREWLLSKDSHTPEEISQLMEQLNLKGLFGKSNKNKEE